MRFNSLQAKIADGRTVVNGWISSNSAYAAEVLAHSGFDCITIDAQHGMLGRAEVVALLQAVSTSPVTPLVRPSRMDVAEIGWLLDAGAYGIIAPSVDTPELAADLVSACFYPPTGHRSFGPTRGLLYGGTDYVANVEKVIMPWAMIESVSAAKHLEAIMATPGLYGVYIGPNDLALDLGLPAGGRITGRVAEIAYQVVEMARQYRLATGIFCVDGLEARLWAEAGFDLVTPGNDMSLLRSAAALRLDQIRGAKA